MKSIKTIEIQTAGKSILQRVNAVQSDSGRQIRCIITDMTIPSGATARIYALKSDKKEVYNNCTVSGNEILVSLTAQMLAVVGVVNCQINIVSGSDIVTSFMFVLDVDKSFVSSSAIESKNEFKALETALKTAKGLQASIDELNDSLASKKDEEYGVFVDNRADATTGYWHKIFTCKTNTTANTNIAMTLSVLCLYRTHYFPSGILTLNIRQNASGVYEPAASSFKWQSATVDISGFLDYFAINVLTDATGNSVELYVYNNAQYVGYKVNVIDKHSRGLNSNLVFTGEKTGAATTTLTTLPSNGTIVYSAMSDMHYDSGWISMTLTSEFKTYNNNPGYAPRYRKIGNIVYVTGIISPSSNDNVIGSSAQTTVFTMPAGYRPAVNMGKKLTGNGSYYCNMFLTNAGVLGVYNFSNLSGELVTPTTSSWISLTCSYAVA